MKLLERLGVAWGVFNLGLPERYAPQRLLGQGAEGEVWLTLDTERRSWVAVKLIRRGKPAWQLEMAAREFRTALTLGTAAAGSCHVNIVRPLELLLTSKHLVLITEYVPGGSLADYLGAHKLSEDAARYFFRQIAAAIAYCHEHQIVYRDVKPANALVSGTRPPTVKLCDFGLADSWATRPAGPIFNGLMGTPGYLAPEIMAAFFQGAAALARRSQECAAAAAAAALEARTRAQADAAARRNGSGSSGKSAAAAGAIAPAAAAPAAGESSSTSSAGGAAAAGGDTSQQRGMRRVSSGLRLSRAASGHVAKLAAAAAAAAIGGGGGGGSSNAEAAAAAAAAALANEEVQTASYNGVAADVYSLGVLLVVMTLRCMPWRYDQYADGMPALDAMKLLYKKAVLQGVSWRDATPGAAKLSAPLAALLDGMLQPDPDRRISLQQVLASAWVNQPLQPTLQCALEVLQEQQAAREAAAAAAAADESGADAALLAERLVQLDEMLEAASRVAPGYKTLSRIVLSRPQSCSCSSGSRQQQPQQQSEDSCSDEACLASIVSPRASLPAAAAAAAAGAGGDALTSTTTTTAAAKGAAGAAAVTEVACDSRCVADAATHTA